MTFTQVSRIYSEIRKRFVYLAELWLYLQQFTRSLLIVKQLVPCFKNHSLLVAINVS